MSKFYFFTDVHLLTSQTLGDQFGSLSTLPADANNPIRDVFRITSLHSSTSQAKAYSICKGNIAIVESNTSGRFNLILQPTDHSYAANKKIALPKIKYIIYRGIDINSLVDEENNIKTDSYLGNKIVAGIAENDSKEIGNHSILNSNSTYNYLYELFDKGNSDDLFTEIDGGKDIGKFVESPSKFGVEIVLDIPGDEPDIDYARQYDYSVEVEQLQTSYTEVDLFKHKHNKERVLRFLDICGFYGSFLSESIWEVSLGEQKGKFIYTNILNYNSQIIFSNKNKIYLDIRNENEYSFNYYGNYSTSHINNNFIATLKIKYNHTASAFTDVALSNNYWPIYSLGVSDYLVLKPSSGDIPAKGKIEIRLPSSNYDDNPNPILFISQGEFDIKDKDKTKIFNIVENGNDSFTSSIGFFVNLIEDSQDIFPICCYVRFKYLKQYSNNLLNIESDKTVVRPLEYLDNCFIPLKFIRTLNWSLTTPPVSTTYKSCKNFTNIDGEWQIQVYENEYFSDSIRLNGRMSVGNMGALFNKDYGNRVVLFFDPVYSFIDANSNKKETHNHISTQIVELKSKNQDIDPVDYSELDAFNSISLGARNIDLNLSAKYSFLKVDGTLGEAYNLVSKSIDLLAFDIKTVEAAFYNPANEFITDLDCFIGLVHVNGGKGRVIGEDKAAFLYEEYELVLRGFKENSSTNTIDIKEVIINEKIFIKSSVPDIEVLGQKVKQRGHGYDFNYEGTSSFYEPNQFQQLQKPTYRIHSRIFLLRGWGISKTDFVDFFNHVEVNIKQVYGTNTNLGIASKYEPDPNNVDDYNTGTFIRDYILSEPDIVVLPANAEQYKKLKDKECLFVVNRGGPIDAVFNFAKRKREKLKKFGRFSLPEGYDISDVINDPVLQNVPAHEFGHILGLSDRYGYVAFIDSKQSASSFADTALRLYDYNRITKGVQVAKYFRHWKNGEWTIFDQDFGERFNWLYNLMSQQEQVPDEITYEDTNSPGNPSVYFLNTRTIRAYMKPYRPTSTTKSIFLTKLQVEIIRDYRATLVPEEKYNHQYVCFIDTTKTDYTKVVQPSEAGYLDFVLHYSERTTSEYQLLSFAGPDEKFGNDQNFASDYGFLFHNGQSTFATFNTDEGKMDKRRRKIGNEQNNCLFGFLNINAEARLQNIPQALPKIDILKVDDLPLTKMSPVPGIYSIDEIATGGSAYSILPILDDGSRSSSDKPTISLYLRKNLLKELGTTVLGASNMIDYVALQALSCNDFGVNTNPDLQERLVIGGPGGKPDFEREFSKWLRFAKSKNKEAYGINFFKILMTTLFYASFRKYPFSKNTIPSDPPTDDANLTLYERTALKIIKESGVIVVDFENEGNKDKFYSPGDSDDSGNGYKIWNEKIIPFIDSDVTSPAPAPGSPETMYSYRKVDRGYTDDRYPHNFGRLYSDGNSYHSYRLIGGGDGSFWKTIESEAGNSIKSRFNIKYYYYLNRERILKLMRDGEI